MNLDIPHMIATAVIIFIVVYGINHQFESMSKGKRTGLTFVILFIALMILNFVWPYG